MDDEQRKSAFVASAMDAWFSTSLELDRSLLSLSAGGIGLLLTIVSFKGLATHWQLVLFVLALTFFVLCIVCVLVILHANKAFLSGLIDKGEASSLHLHFMDNAARGTFFLGILLSAVLGVAAAIGSVNASEEAMNSKSKLGGTGMAQDSFAGAASLQGQPLKKSYDGAQSLLKQPAQQPASGGQGQTQQQQTGTSNTQTETKPGG